MDQLEAHQVKIYYHDKRVQCLDDSGKNVEIVGVQPISLYMICAMQLKHYVWQSCQLFAVRMNELDEGESHDDIFHHHPILQEFLDVFLSEIPSVDT